MTATRIATPVAVLLLIAAPLAAQPAWSQGCPDADGDGVTTCQGDCNDADPNVHPGAPELCNGVDDNCDYFVPLNERDTDGDGVRLCDSPPDCNDYDAGVYPGNVEVCGDNKDNDCNGLVDEAGCTCPDADGDGYTAAVCGGADCNDADPAVHPGATESCTDGVDNDCDGLIDRADPDAVGCPNCTDADGDGYAVEGGACGAVDCDDTDPRVHPNAAEDCDGKDSDCDGVLPPAEADADGDGYPLCAGDCDDTDAAVHPGAVELCNGRDDDCDYVIPGNERDLDGDGVALCQGDCNDNDPTAFPGNVEACADGVDNDCDGAVDEAGCVCPDRDRDGYTDAACGGGDCDDTNPAVHPTVAEACNDGIDNDCNGATDCADAACSADAQCQACAAADQDGDGYSTAGGVCGPVDCDDTDASVHPGATEVCDGKDTDCDGVTPANEADADGDGYPLCAGDCDDANANVHPGAAEICDGLDDNCDYVVPGNERDLDGDGIRACDTPPDCNDVDATAYPGAPELCLDQVDNDCDGAVDEADCTCVDNDGDGYQAASCGGDDCDDTDPNVHPGATEVCTDGIDNDCNGLVDLFDEVPCLAGCVDADLDGYKDAACGGSDCDDTDPLVNPGMQEVCDGKDTNCDGQVPPDDVDADGDGYPACSTDCDDTNPAVHPGAVEVCDDTIDNNCDGAVDLADLACAALTCGTRTDFRDPPHLAALLNPDGTQNPDDQVLRCGKCHNPAPGQFFDDTRYQCQRCHADPADTSDPLNGVLKAQYPLPWPYGFGSAPNVKTHSSDVLGTKYGTWGATCVTCHNPHMQEQNRVYGASYGKLIKQFICFDNAATGEHWESPIRFTAPDGFGSFADGPPHAENICETCHTRTNHHRRTGDAPGDLDANGNYQPHHDNQSCITCHHHADGFKPTGGEPRAPHNTPFFLANCQFCHVQDANGQVNFSTPIPNSQCKQCHGQRDAHSSDPAQNPYASGKYTYDFKCVDCHDPMFSVGQNRKLIREINRGSVVAGSVIHLTKRSGPGSFADGPPHDENICETCHSQTDHHRHDGTAPGDFDASGNYQGHHDGAYCMICHDHNRAFMKPGPTQQYEQNVTP